MLEDYFILSATLATITLVWRNLKEDHPALKSSVASIPFFGGALSCGFCFAVWVSLLGVMLLDPLNGWYPTGLHAGGGAREMFLFTTSWFSVSVGVLFIRSIIIVLLELGAVLKHQHQSGHNK